MKKTLLFFLIIFSLSSIPQTYSMVSSGPSGQPGGMSMGQGGLIPQPTEEEMRYIMEEFLPSLSDEELEELAKIGQEIMDTAEKEGIPLWKPQEPATNKPAPATPVTVSQKEILKEQPVTKKAAPNAAKKRLIHLITIIDSIRQKASSDQELEDDFSPLDKQINSLLYYLHVLNDEKLITFLIDKEFSELNEHLKELRYDLEVLNNKFIIPAQKIHQTKKEEALHNDMIKKAETILKEIMQRFQKAFKQEAIIVEIEALLKKYEPEALKTKKEMDEAEKKAVQFIKTLPKTNNAGARPGFGGLPGGIGGRGPGAQQGAQPFNRITPGNTTSRAQIKPTNSPKKPETPKKTDDKKKPPVAKVTIGSLESNIISKLNDLERFLDPLSFRLNDFADNYKLNKTEDATLKPLLQEAHLKAKRLKKEIDSWHGLIEKEITEYKDMQDKKKKISNLWENKGSQPKTTQLYDKMKMLETKKVPMQGEFKNLYIDFKKIEEKILEVA